MEEVCKDENIDKLKPLAAWTKGFNFENMAEWDKGTKKHKSKFQCGSVVSICVGITLISIGSVELGKCQLEPMIPIYLIGSYWLTKILTFLDEQYSLQL